MIPAPDDFNYESTPEFNDALSSLDDLNEAWAIAARVDSAAMAGYVLRDELTGRPILLAPMHEEWHDLAAKKKRLIIWSYFEAGKCLAPDTGVLRSDGVVVRADAVRVGDRLLGPDGTPRNVLSLARGNAEMFRITPTKGSPWVCNDVHVLTLVHTNTNAVIDIGLDEYLKKPKWWKDAHKLFQPGPVDFEETTSSKDRPLSPYFVGIWLGDGTKDLHSVCITKPDPEIKDACEREAAAFGVRSIAAGGHGCPAWRLSNGVPGQRNPLLTALREIMGDAPHVPDAYLRGSRIVRAEVLAGLLDTDGHYDPRRKCFEIAQKSELIANGVEFLAQSLGIRVTRKIKLVNGAPYHRLQLSGDLTVIPNRIPRKQAVPRTGGRDSRRTGFVVESIGRGPYAGFTLDGDARFLLSDFTVTHNSSQLSVAYPLFVLGNNPNKRIAIVSSTEGGAKKITGLCGRYIERSQALRQVFPGLVPDKSVGWSATSLFVQRTDGADAKDPSIQTAGINSQVIGSRIDLLILDDILNHDNVRTPEARKEVFDRIVRNYLNRLTRDGQVIFVGNAWHPEDAMHMLALLDQWFAVRYSVRGHDGLTTWPENWPEERIVKMEHEFGPLEAPRQLYSIARNDEEARFKKPWLQRAIERGDGKTLPYAIEFIPRGYGIFTGVDLSIGESKKGDLTSFCTIVMHPNEDREILNVEAGRWVGPEILEKLFDIHRRYKGIIFVESNAAQQYLVQFARAQSSIPVKSFVTGKNKMNPEFGIESIATEMYNGKWIIPSDSGALHPQLRALVGEMINYVPGAHTGDRLMSLWIAREASRQSMPKTRSRHLDITRR